MHLAWLKGLKGPDKERRKDVVLSYRNAFDDLKNILEGQLEIVPLPDYDSPSWAYKQADTNGHNRALESVIRLINIKDKAQP